MKIINWGFDNAFHEGILSYYDMLLEELGKNTEEDEKNLEEMIQKAFWKFCPSDISVGLVQKTREYYMKNPVYRAALNEYKDRIIIPAYNANFSEIIEKYIDVYKIIDISVDVVFECALEILKYAEDCKDLEELGFLVDEDILTEEWVQGFKKL